MFSVRYILMISALSLAPSVFAEQAAPEQAVNTTSPEELQEWFDQGYSSFKKGRYHRAVSNLHKFKVNRYDDTLNSDWAMFFLALSYDRSGLTQAAVDTFNQLLKKQANPQIVNASLYRLDEISRQLPHDEALLIDQTVITLDFDYIDADLKPFILFSQGRYNWSKGFIEWGNEQFAKLPEGHYYHHKFKMLDAQRLVFAGEVATAKAQLESLLNKPDIDPALQGEIQQFLARLNFEYKQFDQSAKLYQQALSKPNHPKSALLELAWTTFLADRPEKAFGLLHAFSSPSFAHAFNPEYFILKAHIYKDHCHYDSAVTTGEQFFTRYQTALDAIYDRKQVDDLEFEAIHQVLLQNTDIQKQWNFALLLLDEQKNISPLWPKETRDELKRIYQLKIDYTRWQLLQSITEQFERVANDLLLFSEQMDLIGYEMGVERFQSSPNSDLIAGQQKQAEKQSLAGKVKYPADGEFWSDEFKDYVATLSNDCLTTENWNAR